MAKENFFDIAYTVKSVEQTRAMYDRWAEIYDSDLTNVEYQQPKRCARALVNQTGNLKIKILDVGCGTGLSGLALKEVGFKEIDGCDLSQGMLDRAAELDVYDKLFSCDLNQPLTSIVDSAYDALTCVGVFSFGHIAADAVVELLRITKPGGFIIIGLNDHYYDEGSLTAKLDTLEADNKLTIVKQEHGEHIPKNSLMGWVITIRKVD